MAADERTWTTVQLCKLTGMSYRQADYMVRTDVMVPAAVGNHRPGWGSGSIRLWTTRQIVVGRAIAVLSDLGMPARVRRSVAETLVADESGLWSRRVLITPDGQVRPLAGPVPVVAGWLVDLAQVWADAEQAMAAELDGELALVG